MTDQALDDLARRVILDAARQEYGDWIDQLPEHDFSPAFEKKMQKLIRRANHPIRYQVMKIAACLLLTAFLSGCAVLAVSPEARAAFEGWVREIYDTWVVYHYNSTTKETPQNVIYRPTWVPNGYEEEHESEQPNKMSIIYKNDNDDMLLFLYSNDPYSISLYVDQEYKHIEQVEVGNNFAYLYMDQREGADNGIVWTASETGTIFLIFAPVSDTDLIKMAESVSATHSSNSEGVIP